MWRLALLLLALPPAAASAQAPEPPASLIVGRWQGESNVGGVPCQPNMICTNVISDVRLGEVRTLAGPRVGKWVTANFEYHAPIVDAAELVLLVWPLPGGSNRYEGQWVGAVWRGTPFCVSTDMLSANGIAPRAGAIIGKTRICFPHGPKPHFVKPDVPEEEHPDEKCLLLVRNGRAVC